MQIRQAETTRELKAVYHFRYKIYIEEMQRKQQYVDHEDRMIIDPLDVPTAPVLQLGAAMKLLVQLGLTFSARLILVNTWTIMRCLIFLPSC